VRDDTSDGNTKQRRRKLLAWVLHAHAMPIESEDQPFPFRSLKSSAGHVMGTHLMHVSIKTVVILFHISF
jgi:hypothetical protein